jgi:UDP-N-acetylmuramoyl-tripeptide--D-alanyl-D-alanine ligase
MVDFDVDGLIAATSCTLLAGSTDAHISSVETDSRKVHAGTLFVCFPGERVDGNDFASAAIEAGAGAVLLTRAPDPELCERAHACGCAILRAESDDPTAFLLRLATAWRARNPRWVVIGVTGSVGKTTTKDMLAAGLATCWRVHATAGNFNNLIGLPLTILSASPEDEIVVCEMGMNRTGELSQLTHVARPTVALITNVGTSHIGLLGSREAIARAKAEIVEGMAASDTPQTTCIGEVTSALILTSDNDFADFIVRHYCVPARLTTVFVGTAQDDVLRYGPVSLDAEGNPSFNVVCADGWTRRMHLSVPGAAVATDCALALAVADHLGADREAVAAALDQMTATHMRLEVVGGKGKPRMIDDSYNASPASMASALDVLNSLPCEGRRIAVLGEMGELGRESRRLHGYVGAYVAAVAPDLVVWIGEQEATEMHEAALVMGLSEDRMELFSDVTSALRVIGPILEPSDLVLVKASRSAGLDAFVRGVLA